MSIGGIRVGPLRRGIDLKHVERDTAIAVVGALSPSRAATRPPRRRQGLVAMAESDWMIAGPVGLIRRPLNREPSPNFRLPSRQTDPQPSLKESKDDEFLPCG